MKSKVIGSFNSDIPKISEKKNFIREKKVRKK